MEFREVGSDEEYLLKGEGALLVGGEVFTPWLKCLRWPWALPINRKRLDLIGFVWANRNSKFTAMATDRSFSVKFVKVKHRMWVMVEELHTFLLSGKRSSSSSLRWDQGIRILIHLSNISNFQL